MSTTMHFPPLLTMVERLFAVASTSSTPAPSTPHDRLNLRLAKLNRKMKTTLDLLRDFPEEESSDWFKLQALRTCSKSMSEKLEEDRKTLRVMLGLSGELREECLVLVDFLQQDKNLEEVLLMERLIERMNKLDDTLKLWLAVIGDVADLPPQIVAKGRALRDAALREKVFAQHDGLMRRLA